MMTMLCRFSAASILLAVMITSVRSQNSEYVVSPAHDTTIEVTQLGSQTTAISIIPLHFQNLSKSNSHSFHVEIRNADTASITRHTFFGFLDIMSGGYANLTPFKIDLGPQSGSNVSMPPTLVFWDPNNDLGDFEAHALIFDDNTGKQIVDIHLLRHVAGLPGNPNSMSSQYNIFQSRAGQMICASMMYRNDSKETVSLNSMNLYGDTVLRVTNRFAGPIILLAGEQAKLCDVCFVPAPGHDTAYRWLTLNFTQGSNQMTAKAFVNCTPYSDLDLQKNCLEVRLDTSYIGPVVAGTRGYGHLIFKNNRSSALTLPSISISGSGGNVFSLTPSASPHTIAAKAYDTVAIAFAPPYTTDPSKLRYVANLDLTLDRPTGDNNCWSNQSLVIYGIGLLPTIDSGDIALYPDSTVVLGIVDSIGKSSKTFEFVNNSGKSVKVVSIGMSNGANFKVTDISPSGGFPFTLGPSGKVAITVTMTSNTSLVYYDSLLIVTEFGAVAQVFPIQGLKLTTASVPMQAGTYVMVRIVPNPFVRSTTIETSGLRNVTVTVFDLLGTAVWSAEHAASFTWNGVASVGSLVSPGMYYVRVSGITSDGAVHTETHPVVLSR